MSKTLGYIGVGCLFTDLLCMLKLCDLPNAVAIRIASELSSVQSSGNDRVALS